MAGKKRHQNQNSSATTVTGSPNKRKHGKRQGSDDGTGLFESATVSYKILVIVIAFVISLLHRNHVAGMFERDKHFSHLSELERELSFRTEMGLYYSYFKTIISAPTFMDGLNLVRYDNFTEYPDTINVLKRFNLYPEVALGIAFRWYKGINKALDRKTKICWTVNRGEGKSPVPSCEGLGEPAYFYTESVFALNGIMMGVFFLFGTYLSGSIYGGILTVAGFLYNHGECTRVQWTPPLRESFAYPFFVIEMFLVTHVIRLSRPNYIHSVFIAVAVVSFMLPWQFAQFALMTQAVAVFGTYALGYIGSHKVKVIGSGLLSGLLISYVLLFGNEMLLTSFFASCIVTVMVIVYLEPFIEVLKFRMLILAVQAVMLLVGTVGIKIAIASVLSVADDEHIGDIFHSKFSDYKNFHTMLYTCAAEFDFMERETPWKVLKTLLLPSVLISLSALGYKVLKFEYQRWRGTLESDVKENGSPSSDFTIIPDGEHRRKPFAEHIYHVFQLLAFTAMAVIIMRLKLFWTPHMALVSSLLASRQLFGWIGTREKHWAAVTVILAGMTYQGIQNLQHQWGIMGEFSNYPLEDLVEWIKETTPKNAVFAGPMPTMATVKLCTNRPIVNHPHYEDAGLRERTKKVYSMYSRKPAEEVKQTLTDLKVDYVILEDSWCTRRSKPGCGMAEIWDIEDVKNRNVETPLCTRLRNNPSPQFSRVFRNEVYDVLKVSKW